MSSTPATVNRVLIAGTIRRKPQLGYIEGDVIKCVFEVNTRMREYEIPVRCVCFQEQATWANAKLRKGSRVFVEGQIGRRRMKEGAKEYLIYDVIVDENGIVLLD